MVGMFSMMESRRNLVCRKPSSATLRSVISCTVPRERNGLPSTSKSVVQRSCTHLMLPSRISKRWVIS